MQKKFLSVLLTLLMMAGVIAVAPIMASAGSVDYGVVLSNWNGKLYNAAASADVTDALAAAGAVVTGGSPDAWELTLTNFSVTTADPIALEVPHGTTIVLVGSNALTSTYNGSMRSSIGLWTENTPSAPRALTITGSGSLTAKSGMPTGMASQGISSNNLTIGSNATVTAMGLSRALVGSAATGDYTVPSGYAYTVSANVDGSGATTGTSDGAFVITAAHKYAQIMNQTHTHSFGSDWVKDATNHWKECACGEKNSLAAHTPGGWIVDVAPTETTDGSQHRTCSVCAYVETETIPAAGVPALTLSTSSWAMGAAAANTSVTVSSNVAWIAGSDAAWIIVTGSGSGNGSFDINVTANTGTGERIGTVAVTGGGITRTVEVTQDGAAPAKGIFGTNPRWTGAWWHYVLFFVGFGFIWMWFF